MTVGCGSGGGSSSNGSDGGPGRSVTLTWEAPTTNATNDDADGTCLTDLKGYKVYYGTSRGVYATPYTVIVGGPGLSCIDTGIPVDDPRTICVTDTIIHCTYTTPDLPTGTWYFAVTAYDTSVNENESAYSNEASIDIL